MACPYFLPSEKCVTIAWAFPRRLPLGAGFCGTCTAGPEPVVPADAELKDLCNLGYASQCPRIPANRSADAVRFAIAREAGGKEAGGKTVVHYACELAHAPAEHGHLEYDRASRKWMVTHANACIQRQAECCLAGYLERTPPSS
ncbi:MAG TPA: hypothetical protein VKT33_08060 [Candidatus Angelobacter sp.]|nr:hypothetical protein [Candidatus Angelobacter sp.]